jgi:hypothetical protein
VSIWSFGRTARHLDAGVRVLIAGIRGGEVVGLRHRRSPVRDAGSLHVEEERRSTAAAGELTLALLGDLASLLAVLAAYSERERPQPLFSNFFAAFEAVAVIALLETRQRIVDLVEGLGLHLNQGKLDFVMDVGH